MAEFTCDCGGTVVPRTGTGRTALYRRGIYRPIPDDLSLHTCGSCGAMFFTHEETVLLDEALQKAEDL